MLGQQQMGQAQAMGMAPQEDLMAKGTQGQQRNDMMSAANLA